MSRRGIVLPDLAGALVGLGLIAALVVGAAAERRAAVADERRSAALETAQNLLAAARAGVAQPMPAGWTVARRRIAGGATEVRVRGEGVELATLVTGDRP